VKKTLKKAKVVMSNDLITKEAAYALLTSFEKGIF